LENKMELTLIILAIIIIFGFLYLKNKR